MIQYKPASFIIITFAVAGLILYTLSLFIYLKITGVYAVATIKEGTPTSEGIDFRYKFHYAGKIFEGVFTGIGAYTLGDKYFVCFSKEDLSKNLLQYNQQVPDCLVDSLFTFWSEIPECSNSKTVR